LPCAASSEDYFWGFLHSCCQKILEEICPYFPEAQITPLTQIVR